MPLVSASPGVDRNHTQRLIISPLSHRYPVSFYPIRFDKAPLASTLMSRTVLRQVVYSKQWNRLLDRSTNYSVP